jgi:aspartyl-tRNA(Asn)/glutamyl-tRNA(Gln) amidotransferase subunit C
MSLSREDVRHVASLARLGLTDDEIETMREQLSSILGHIEVMNQLDTDAIPPTAQVIDLQNVQRQDAVRDSLPQDVLMKMAPASRDGFVAVSEVLGGTDEGGSA